MVRRAAQQGDRLDIEAANNAHATPTKPVQHWREQPKSMLLEELLRAGTTVAGAVL